MLAASKMAAKIRIMTMIPVWLRCVVLRTPSGSTVVTTAAVEDEVSGDVLCPLFGAVLLLPPCGAGDSPLWVAATTVVPLLSPGCVAPGVGVGAGGYCTAATEELTWVLSRVASALQMFT